MTEPKDTEASWLSEALLRFVVERAALALSLYDAQGRLLWCNQVARETLGDVGARVADPAGELVALGELPDDGPLVQERRFVRSDGTVMWGLLTLNWVQGRGDGDRHALATLTELNVHKRAELMQKALASNMRSSADAVVGLEPNGTDGSSRKMLSRAPSNNAR